MAFLVLLDNLIITTSDPLIYIMDHPKIIVANEKEESISTQRVERLIAPAFRPCIYFSIALFTGLILSCQPRVTET